MTKEIYSISIISMKLFRCKKIRGIRCNDSNRHVYPLVNTEILFTKKSTNFPYQSTKLVTPLGVPLNFMVIQNIPLNQFKKKN